MTKRWFNLGNKDEYGQQCRVEHRGQHLRVSRTGGASLRAQTKAAGVNLTANSQQGMRVSRTIGRNTQLALQNGRLVFRGRYGSGANKLNLSKTGATLSTRNALGSFNWIKPNRSAAKLFGVQVRGKKAASLQIVYMLVQVLITFIELAIMLVLLMIRWLQVAAFWIKDLLRELPFLARQALRRYRVWRQRRRLRSLSTTVDFPVPESEAALLAAMATVLLAWGRGKCVKTWAAQNDDILAKQATAYRLCTEIIHKASDRLQTWQESLPWQLESIALVAADLLGHASRQKLPPERLPELLLDLDDLALQQGQKTLLQEDLLAAFSDAAGLKLVGKRTSTWEPLEQN